jgi:hypothetical protein
MPIQPQQLTSFHERVEVLTGEEPAIYPENLRIGLTADDQGGLVTVQNNRGKETIRLNGAGGNSTIGGNGFDGALTLINGNAQETVALHSSGTIRLFHPIGGNPHIELVADEVVPENSGGGLVNVTDGKGNITIRLTGNAGTIEAKESQNSGKAVMSAGNGHGGALHLFHPNGGNPHIELLANEVAPDNTGGGLVNVADGGGRTTIQLVGHTGTIVAPNLIVSGDIVLTQADCSEDFDMAEAETSEPGSVMVIDAEGKLKRSDTAYDHRVAGVISGAGDYKPGITLDRQSPEHAGRMPIALSGKIYCKVDSDYAVIDVGDLLVSSPTPAHAMKAVDVQRAFGAVIGKALRPLKKGRGLIPILVSLQ